MIAAIFIAPLVYLLNAFFIGRLIKRWKISSNSCFDTIIGFFVLLVITYIISSWLYIGKVSILIYGMVFGIIQCFLAIAYIANWRYIFITSHFDWKKVLFFSLGVGITLVISFLCFREFKSSFALYWHQTLENIPSSVDGYIWFGLNETDVITNFCANNVLNIIWLNVFHVTDVFQAEQFCNWSWAICASIIVGCMVQWLTNKQSSMARTIFSLVIVLFNVIVTLAFIESYAVPDAWLMLELTVFLLVLLQEKSYGKFKLGFLTILMLAMLATSPGAYFLVIALWLYSIYWAIRNQENSINYLICLTWPLMLSIFGLLSLSIYTYWFLAAMQALYLILMIINLSIFFKVGTPAWETKLARGIYNHSGKIVYVALGIIIALVFVINFFIFHEIYDWKPENINYRNFLTFTYREIWNISITSDMSIGIFNAVLYAFFAAIIVTFIVVRKTKKTSFYHLTKSDSAIKLVVVTALLFCNPLFIHILKLGSQLNLNTSNLNMFLIVPIIVFLLEVNGNTRISPIKNWAYNWY